jgi:hypothetical protein
MMRANSFVLVLAALFAGLTTGACATQSDSIRRTTAENHELAANGLSPPGAFGATTYSHWAAAERLREVEQATCAEVPESDRDQGPLARRDRIAAIEPLSVRPYPKDPILQPAGVAVYLRAAPGMTEQSLGRVLECHLAHHAVVGDRVADRTSPLFVDDARVALSATGDGFRIAITARDVTAARQIIERARALAE